MTKQLSLDPEKNLDHQIDEILQGVEAPRPLEKHERSMLMVLRGHKGPKNAIQISALGPRIEQTDRGVKATAKALIEEFGAPIGASRQEPYGYYLCVTADDIEQACRPLEGEFFSLAKRLKALRGGARLIELLGQLRLDVENRSQL